MLASSDLYLWRKNESCCVPLKIPIISVCFADSRFLFTLSLLAWVEVLEYEPRVLGDAAGAGVVYGGR